MPPLLVLDDILTPSYAVMREMVAPQLTAPLGSGVIQHRRQWSRPLTRFILRAPQETFTTSTALWSFYAYHQSDIPFRFSGLQYGDLTRTPGFLAFGDGTTRDLLLPHRNVSLVAIYVGSKTLLGASVPLVVVNSAAGTVRLSSAPAVDTYIRASYRTWYKCVFDQGAEDVLLHEEWTFQNISQYETLTLLEVPF